MIDDEPTRTLAVVLCMGRSGSSLTANILHDLGLSLGPWELLPADPSNPKGYYESTPILELSCEIQGLVYGFINELPESAETEAAFLEGQGRWDERAESTAAPFLERGRAIIEGLLRSGPISGFKDPRTVLLWPFWKRVLEAFPGVRVVPIALVRSPHEIAMSIFARRSGECGYWTNLDVVAVHFQKLAEIVAGWNGPAPTVRFGGPDYFDDLRRAALACGLEWSEETARRVHDGAHVHQRPAVVPHRAQVLHDAIAHAPPSAPADNAERLEADARRRDRAQLDRFRSFHEYVKSLQYQCEQAHARGQGAVEQIARDLKRAREEIRGLEQAREDCQRAREAVDRLEAERDAALARVEAVGREAEQARADWRALRDAVDKVETHPLLGPAVRGRRELKRILGHIRG